MQEFSKITRLFVFWLHAASINGLTLILLLANYEMTQKTWKMTETLVHGYSSEITLWELSNECQHDRFFYGFQTFLRPGSLDESRLSIGRVKMISNVWISLGLPAFSFVNTKVLLHKIISHKSVGPVNLLHGYVRSSNNVCTIGIWLA